MAGGEDLDALRAEVERGAGHYYHTPQQFGVDNRAKRFVIARCEPHLRGPQVLELGYVDGLWTDVLLSHGFSVDIVEGATAHVEHARARYGQRPSVRLFHQIFQEFAPDRPYDCVVAGDMLRYLAEPLDFLQRARGWLREDGVLLATLPNSRSLHRRIGCLMGLEPSPSALNQRDREVGNRRGYDRYEFHALLEHAGYIVRELHGCFLKPLSSAQMEDWDEELLGAFLKIGDELEDYCWFMYAVCARG
jgi:2-polyprenyl-3-methyl-5-hydroxy-6-metoxy-1,4-benzoquinol methylase